MPKTNRPKIVFLGTPNFGRIILENLLEANFPVIGVITQPDRPTGRNHRMTPSPVKLLAKERGIRTFTPASKTELSQLEAKLRALKPSLFVVAAYGMIIPPEILAIPTRGALNVHPSLLPKYRGASPIQAAILNGERETGVTIMQLDEELDHGPVLAHQKISLAPRETTPTLTEKLAQLGGKLLTETIPLYQAGKITPQPQNHELATFTKLIEKEDGKINWEWPNEKIERMIRAYTPWPGVWTTVGEMATQLDRELRNPKQQNLKLKILAAHLENGTFSLDRVQVEGRNPITFSDFVKGYLS